VNTVNDLRERLSETPELYVLTYQTQLHDLSRVGQATGIRTMDPVPHGEGPLPKHPPLMLTKLTRQHAAPATAPATGADDRLAGQTETSNEHRQ
jgi:hypothetical protein